MTAQSTVVDASRRISAGAEADRLARAAYDALLTDLRALEPADWEQPTECAPWTVRDMVAHLAGAAKGYSALGPLLRQAALGRRRRRAHDGSDLDAMNQLQIDDHEGLGPDELVAELTAAVPDAVAGRARLARLFGWAPVPLPTSGSAYPGMPSRVSMRELFAVVLTRDVWLHRWDIARAVGREPAVTAELDGRLVEDVVVEWCLRHGRPVRLELTGPAGGLFVTGDAPGGAQRPTITMDAVDFVRLMAGRRADGAVPDSPLLATKVLF